MKSNSSKIIKLLSAVIIVLFIVIVILISQLVCFEDSVEETSDNFTVNEEEKHNDELMEEVQGDLKDDSDICIETPYVTLHFPIEWKDNIDVNIEENGASCKVTFCAKVEGKENIDIFSIHFNEDGTLPIGKLEQKDGSEVYVNLSAASLEFDDMWSTEEKDMVCAMQEDSNYLIETISKEKNFSK